MIIILVILIILYLYLICPKLSRRKAMKPYEKKFLAHRGLFNNLDVPENSLPAFKKAVANDFGIELDVQLTTDDQLVVFHDASLKRMTGIDKDLTSCSYEELQSYSLLETDEKIPLFKDVLACLKPDTPLVIEIKSEGDYIATTKKAVEMTRDYQGLFNMESFNPMVIRYLRMHEPQVIRGQLAYSFLSDKESKIPWLLKFALSNLLLNAFTRPDYVAFDCKGYENFSFRIVSKLLKGECVAWTVRSDEVFKKIKPYYNCFIFDSYLPDNADL
ncbi:MAG: hypothetical protein IJI46_00875 [Erysipelotrichaceae bacterium]|nr:hypothetical protein [Erysipelotrichaceae bacterium]